MTRPHQLICALWHWFRYHESHLTNYGYRDGKLFWHCWRCGKESWQELPKPKPTHTLLGKIDRFEAQGGRRKLKVK